MKPYLCFTRSLALSFSIIILSACSSDSANTDRSGDNLILFEPCEDGSGLDCGEFEVPLIHDSTDNRKITIKVARLSGTGDGPHEPLLLNLGGPGSGIEALQGFAQPGVIPVAIRERYNIIGFDQRGVSSPPRVDCDDFGNAMSVTYPRNQTDLSTLVADYTMLADACSAEHTDQLQWVGSNAVVQDMEIMRMMLNAPRLNIIGASFGTRITALYQQRFPTVSGRIILDAPLPPHAKIDTMMRGTAAAQQHSFDLMLNACGTTLPDCERAEVEAAFVARVNILQDEGDLDTFNAFFNLMSLAIAETEIGELLAPLLIDYAIGGDPTDMFTLIEDFGLDEGEQESDQNERLTLERAVVCADDAARPSLESLIAQLGSLNESSDFFAETLLPLAASCIGWPAALDPVNDIRTTDAPASLVIGGIGDVRTPISWAVETADATGGIFLSSGHQGHTTIFLHGNDCVETIVVGFLVDGTLPPVGTSCN